MIKGTYDRNGVKFCVPIWSSSSYKTALERNGGRSERNGKIGTEIPKRNEKRNLLNIYKIYSYMDIGTERNGTDSEI